MSLQTYVMEALQLLCDSTAICDTDPLSPSSQSGSMTERSRAAAKRGGLMSNIFPLRQRFAKGIRQLAEVTADHLSKWAPIVIFLCLQKTGECSDYKMQEDSWPLACSCKVGCTIECRCLIHHIDPLPSYTAEEHQRMLSGDQIFSKYLVLALKVRDMSHVLGMLIGCSWS